MEVFVEQPPALPGSANHCHVFFKNKRSIQKLEEEEKKETSQEDTLHHIRLYKKLDPGSLLQINQIYKGCNTTDKIL